MNDFSINDFRNEFLQLMQFDAFLHYAEIDFFRQGQRETMKHSKFPDYLPHNIIDYHTN